jgi:hypothetical protein
LLGELELPQHALYGIATARALENYQITGIPLHHFPELIIGLAYVKKASARANFRLGLLDANVARAIEQACDDLISSKQVRPDGAFPNQAARRLRTLFDCLRCTSARNNCCPYIVQYSTHADSRLTLFFHKNSTTNTSQWT